MRAGLAATEGIPQAYADGNGVPNPSHRAAGHAFEGVFGGYQRTWPLMGCPRFAGLVVYNHQKGALLKAQGPILMDP
jgi:hypothetical protein